MLAMETLLAASGAVAVILLGFCATGSGSAQPATPTPGQGKVHTVLIESARTETPREIAKDKLAMRRLDAQIAELDKQRH